MKVLVIGSGGREHALVKKISESPRVEKIFCAPGNAGTGMLAENIDIAADDIKNLTAFAKENSIDLTVVGPEDPLVFGIVDAFRENGLLIFGPDKVSAQLEGSKSFTKHFLYRHNIPTASYAEYTDYHEAVEGLKNFKYPLVIKADGLCAGKGVVICETPVEALYTLKDILVEKKFKDEGNRVVIEEFLKGYEASVFCICSKGKLHFFGTAKDYKKIYDGDKGPNTGGVGCFSPNILLDFSTKEIIKKEIIPKIEKGLIEDKLDFSGVLFIGFMVTKEGPQILEFNVRFGDPETQVLLPRVESDFYTILEKATLGTLEDSDIKLREESAMTVIITSGGYPASYKKGYKITGVDEFIGEDRYVIHNGTALDEENNLITSGGRVLSLVSTGNNLSECRKSIYDNIEKIKFTDSYHRNDIGKIGLQ